MSSSATDILPPRAREVIISGESLTVELSDGRALSVPLTWFPRLWHGTAEERGRWRLIGEGRGIHWPDLDEDIDVEGLLQGRASAESQDSLRKWLAARPTHRAQPTDQAS
jgi:hypothetical protein